MRISGQQLLPIIGTLFLINGALGQTALTWNMEYFPSRGPSDASQAPSRILAVQKILKTINPDILLLQEISDWKSAQAAVANLDAVKVHVVTSFRGSRQQLAIASRFLQDSSWYEAFKFYDGEQRGPPRGFAFVVLRPPDGSYLLIYNVHFKSNRGDKDKNVRAREEAARQLVSHIAEYRVAYALKGKVSVIVGGDFNTLQDDPAYAQEQTIPLLKAAGLSWCWEGVPREQRTTWPAQGGFKDATFDHFFSSGLSKAIVKLQPHTGVSDHSAVLLSW